MVVLPEQKSGVASSPASSLIITRSGFQFHVRPVTAADTAGMASLMSSISEEDVLFRFATDENRTLQRMSQVDHDRTENFVALDDANSIVATAMLASSASGKTAEVAIAVHADYRDHGIGWMLLHYIVGYAQQHGLRSLESVQSLDDHTVIDLEREMGFVSSPYPGDLKKVLLTKTFAHG